MVVKKNTELTDITIALPDIHCGFEDRESIDNVLEYVSDVKPNHIVQIGDYYDCHSISRFDKEPSRIDTLQEELDIGYRLWKDIQRAAPKATYTQLEGNHERRLHKTLLANPGLYSLKNLQPRKLFNLDELGIEWVPAEKTKYLNNSLVLTHGANDDGCKMSPHSAYSAKANLDKWGVSGISGHTHRLGSHYKMMAEEMLGWHEIGCLTKLNPGYVKNPNWQQGFATIYHSKNRFHVVLTAITNHQFMAGGRKYG